MISQLPSTQDDYTPLLAATSQGQRDVVKVLLKHGADPLLIDNNTSESALQVAMRQKHEEIKEMLVQAEVDAAEKVCVFVRACFYAHACDMCVLV